MVIFEIAVWCIFGMVIGSFINLCLDRLPLQFLNDESRKQYLAKEHVSEYLKTQLQNGTLNLSTPKRSFCFACGHQLKWYENIPVLSCLFTRFHCQKCNVFYGYRTLWAEAGHGFFYGCSSLLIHNNLLMVWVNIHFSFLWILGYLNSFPNLKNSLKLASAIMLISDLMIWKFIY